MAKNSAGALRKRFVRALWASHNDSREVTSAIETLLSQLGEGRGLNVGSGDTRLDPRIVNFDVSLLSCADVLGDAISLPFASSAFALVISQEVVEHISDPFLAVKEMARMLKTGGRLYLQVPFIIGYHPGPEDYWRFTKAGARRLVENAGLACESVEQSVSGGTGFYRIAVEFWAGLISRIFPGIYLPAKAFFSIVFYPLTFWNGWLRAGTQADRIPGGYFVIGRKL